jgi:hypothetical protein
MALCYDDLVSFNIDRQDIDPPPKDLYQILKNFRNKKIEAQQQESTQHRDTLKVKHDKSIQIIEYVKDIVSCVSIKDDQRKQVKDMLLELNRSGLVETELKITKTLVLIDATGSMGSTLQKTKNSVEKMFGAAATVLRENGMEENLF